MQNLLEIGKIVRTHGIKGAVKVVSFLDDDLSAFKHVFIGENKLSANIKSINALNNDSYSIVFDEIADIDSAEKFKNKSIYIDRNEYPKYENAIYLSDLTGTPVLNEKGEKLGEYVDFEDYGATVILQIRVGAITYSVPYVDEIISYDKQKRAFIINEQTFKDVRV